MLGKRIARGSGLIVLVGILASCGSGSSGGLFSTTSRANREVAAEQAKIDREPALRTTQRSSTLGDLFGNNTDPNTTVEVNKYLWQASLEVLDFLPIQSVDPFSGVIVTGYGTPPGGGRAYRATVYVQDPALDARSLKLALETSGGAAVSTETTKAVEDAIMTRARQLRIRDSKL
ncbi:DUF3576 domain-containing protein [Albirhodobacter sp. R86504]|jgi:hypothetical protein|uniref:DUF3576 domain-containing protein n=1 Tax=Albirhodobacter sp. R86504 TaxID=3093848 RepID=UPI0036735395